MAREGQLYVGGERAAPFGGNGASGVGRELGPDGIDRELVPDGIDEFLDLEDISMAPMP